MIDLYYSILFYLSYQSLIYLYYLLNYNYHLLFLWSMFDLHHLPNHNCTILLHTISLFSLINIWLTPLAKSQLHRSTCLINLINHIYYIIYLIISIIDLYYLLNNNYHSLFLRPMFDLHYSSNHSIEPFHLSCLNHSPVYYLLDHNSYLLPFAWLMIDLYYLRLSYRIFLKQ